MICIMYDMICYVRYVMYDTVCLYDMYDTVCYMYRDRKNELNRLTLSHLSQSPFEELFHE